MAKHIGIAACSAEGAALCFREIASYGSERMGEHLHPQVTLSCIAMGEWMPAFDGGDLRRCSTSRNTASPAETFISRMTPVRSRFVGTKIHRAAEAARAALR